MIGFDFDGRKETYIMNTYNSKVHRLETRDLLIKKRLNPQEFQATVFK